MWADGLDEAGGPFIAKNDHPIHGSQGAQNLRAIVFVVQWPVGAFQGTDARVRIQRHDHRIAQSAGIGQVADVASMQEIEAAIGEDQFLALRVQLITELPHFGSRGGGEISFGHAFAHGVNH
jgi:hypothetical protein